MNSLLARLLLVSSSAGATKRGIYSLSDLGRFSNFNKTRERTLASNPEKLGMFFHLLLRTTYIENQDESEWERKPKFRTKFYSIKVNAKKANSKNNCLNYYRKSLMRYKVGFQTEPMDNLSIFW